MSNRRNGFSLGSLLVAGLVAICWNLPKANADAGPANMPWLHEGSALTFTWYAAVAAGNGSDYKEDENGDWVNPTTGQHFNRTTQSGTSGNGWTQVVISCIDKDKVVVTTQSFGNAGQLGNSVPVPLQGANSGLATLEQGADYWMDPGKIALLRTDATVGLLVTQVHWPMGAEVVDATRVQQINDGNYTLHVFDSKTGLCLHFASAARGAAPKLVGPGDMGQADVTLTHTDLVSQRDLNIPWAHEATPDWLASLNAVHYRGSITSRGSLPTIPNELTLDLATSDRGKNWILLDRTENLVQQGAPESPPDKAKVAYGRCQFGGLWAGTTAMASFTVGQVLDDDPVTKMKTVVARITDDSIVIAQANDAGEIDSKYDRSTGLLTGIGFMNVLSKQQIAVRVTSRE